MDLFSPLPQKYCLFFYLTMFLGFVIMIISMGMLIFGIFRKFDAEKLTMGVLAVLTYFIVYFQNRLLYSMCVKSGSL